MPKIKYLSASQLRAFIQEFGQDIFFTDGTVLLCNICNVKVSAEKRFFIEQHLLRDKHILGVKRCELQKEVEEKTTQSFITDTPNRSEYLLDLTRTLLSCNSPLNKLKNPVL